MFSVFKSVCHSSSNSFRNNWPIFMKLRMHITPFESTLRQYCCGPTVWERVPGQPPSHTNDSELRAWTPRSFEQLLNFVTRSRSPWGILPPWREFEKQLLDLYKAVVVAWTLTLALTLTLTFGSSGEPATELWRCVNQQVTESSEVTVAMIDVRVQAVRRENL
jgi:hypothetical protein